MRVLLDSSVIISALVFDHEQNRPSHGLIVSAAHRAIEAFASTHAWAETYSQFTGHPLFRVSPTVALKSISASMHYICTMELGSEDYGKAFDRAVQLAVTGGGFFDLLHVRAAEKADVDVLATWNLADFRRIYPEGPIQVLPPSEVLKMI